LSEVDVLLGQVIPAVEAAVGAYGAGLLTRIVSDAVGASATLGERLLARIWHRVTDRDDTHRAIDRLTAAGSSNPKAVAAFSAYLREAIVQDAALRRELAALVRSDTPDSGSGVTFAGDVRISVDRSSVGAGVIQGGVRLGDPTPPARP
jgi:hypothetical protein